MRTPDGMPVSVTRDRLIEALGVLGLDAARVRSVAMDRHAIEAVVYAVDEHGHRYARGDVAATHQVTIPIVDPCPECGRATESITQEVRDVPYERATQHVYVETEPTYRTYKPCGHNVQIGGFR